MVWLVIGYVRLSLIYVWYCLMVLAWEQHCWSESCAACPPGAAESLCTSYRTNCHVELTTVAKGYPVWWLFAMCARSTLTLSLTLSLTLALTVALTLALTLTLTLTLPRYAWSKPESFSALMDANKQRPSTARLGFG